MTHYRNQRFLETTLGSWKLHGLPHRFKRMQDLCQPVLLNRDDRNIAVELGHLGLCKLLRLLFGFGKTVENVFGDIESFCYEDAVVHDNAQIINTD